MSTVVWEQHLTISADELPLTFVDVETTGLSPHFGDRICEVAAVHFCGRDEVARLVTLVNPGRSISPGAAAVNHITSDMVRDAPRFAEVAESVSRLLHAGITVAHNAPFDLAFLAQELAAAGLPLPATPVIDTLALARRCFSFPSNSLGNVASALGVAGLAGTGHRALADALTTRAVFEHFLHLLAHDGQPVTLGTILARQGGNIGWRGTQPSTNVILPQGLGEAVRDRCRLKLSYLSPHGTLTERWVEPIQVIAQRGAAYLVAFCHLRQEQRTFKVDRIVRWERGGEGV